MTETWGSLTVRRGTVRDADTMLALFDDAVRWLTERGRTGQWGTAPFSAIPQRVQQVRGWAEAGALRVAERDGLTLAMSSVGPAPAYVSPATEPELYVMGLVGRRAPDARGAGAALLADARDEAVRLGLKKVRVDCWAGGGGALVQYYVRAGFTPVESVQVEAWQGQVLELRVDQ
ncbi:GNAT family N-acetyltransferase [Crossiella sp. CA-258035]|uniref:GNAT family N-acetyltransferase n=1 Tax=Crossiella sp. CA-258035 TaxID=2981138 RepID=UPI0024BC8E9C|nr:GNAT family N-acetyltransferase [Crossiella sp. CA-258035]WHT20683.1 GNAT family N-acetyltransferase [Crossiella sp. CA-258035]